MMLPSNAEVAAVLRGLFGERVLLLGPPDLVAEEVLRTVRLAISRSEISATQEARFNGEKALAEWEGKHGGGK